MDKDEDQHGKKPRGDSVPLVRKPYSDEEIGRNVQKMGMILFTTTFYTSVDSTRFQLCLQMIHEACTRDLPVVIVDSSPHDVHEALKNTNGISKLARQTYIGRKGAGLREAAQIASELPGVTPDTILCFQEPEKVMMTHDWMSWRTRTTAGAAAADVVTAAGQDVMVMYRSHSGFKSTYPIEQYHSEMYGNLLLDQVAKNEMAKLGRQTYLHESLDLLVQREIENSETKLPSFDWHFGPFAFKAKHVELWTMYNDGDMYDAQLVPIVHAFRKGLNVCSVYCNYQHPKEMKQEEEGNVDATLKRLQQLHDLDPRVIQAWTEDFYC